jgi:hypothetical protein
LAGILAGGMVSLQGLKHFQQVVVVAVLCGRAAQPRMLAPTTRFKERNGNF